MRLLHFPLALTLAQPLLTQLRTQSTHTLDYSEPLPPSRTSTPQHILLGKIDHVLQIRAPDDFMLHLGFGWAHTFKEFASWLPARSAVNTLKSFYSNVIHNSLHVWPLAAPSNTLSVSQGALTLRIHCPTKTIPWTMIRDIANSFLDATELGFTGRFEGRFIYLGTGSTIATITTIYVSLKVNHLQTM